MLPYAAFLPTWAELRVLLGRFRSEARRLAPSNRTLLTRNFGEDGDHPTVSGSKLPLATYEVLLKKKRRNKKAAA